LLPAAYWFFRSSFPRQFEARLLAMLTGFCGAAAGLTLVLGPAVGEVAMEVYEIVALGALAYFTVALVRAVGAGERGAVLSLVGWLACAGAVVHDIMLDNGLVSGINLIPFGFIAFFLCQSGALAARFHSNFRRAEELSRQLRTVNEGLEVLVAERTRALLAKVSELELREEELTAAKAEATSANVAKSRFLATMSHELRTPLNAILGFSEVLQSQTLAPAGEARTVEYAQIINQSGAHLLSLINDILDLSKIEAGKWEMHAEPFEVGEVVAEAVRLATSREPIRARPATVRVAPDAPLLNADRRALIQMIVNLVSNAKKFTPPDGEVVIAAGLDGGGGIQISVSDTGVGMAPEDIPRALEVFGQLDNSLARKHQGTGLGLPIVNSLMQLHGGRLDLVSERGKGTTATLCFPPTRTATRAAKSNAA